MPEPGLFVGSIELNDHLCHLLDPFSLGVAELEEAGCEVVVDGDVELNALLLHLRVNVLLVIWVNRDVLKEGRGSMQIIVNALKECFRSSDRKGFWSSPSCKELLCGTSPPQPCSPCFYSWHSLCPAGLQILISSAGRNISLMERLFWKYLSYLELSGQFQFLLN